MLRKLAIAATIAALALFTRTPLAHAQRALVYCPVGIDATGCDRIVGALTSKFTEGVDRGYDGSAGTVDLAKVDLHHYAVFVVPSLADDSDKQPYAQLRKVASRLHYAINGRVAVYSGAPDQGNSNRADKDALIQNLASWASDGHTRKTGLVGMVAFLDLSENESTRYSWVHDVSLVDVSADTEDQSIGAATPIGTRGGDLLKVNGRQLAFSNMASNGLHIGNRGAARTEVGAIGGTTAHQSVLVTYSNADGAANGLKTTKVSSTGGPSYSLSAGTASLDVSGSSGATTSAPTLSTNKPDYVPGDTVTFTGSGFSPGDTVTITVHVDSTQSFPDRQYQSVADVNGALKNSQMIVVTSDLNMFFTATAVANPSGLVAQTQFTDAGSISASPSPVAVGATVTVGSGGGQFHGSSSDVGIYWDGALNATSGTLVTTCSTNNGGNIQGTCSFNVPAGATAGSHNVVATEPASSSGPLVSFLTTVNVLPSCTGASISINPANTTKNALQSATFSVTGAGTSLTYQWQVSTDNGTTFTPLSDGGSVSGSVTSTLTINPVSGTDNGKQYRVVVSASCGSPVTSTAATLTVNKINQTTAVTVTAPSSVTFGATGTAAATGGDGTGSYTFSVGTSTGCSVLGTTVSVSDASGTCTLTATRAGDNNYNASSASAAFPVTLSKATQAALSLTVPTSITFGATGTATTTGGSGTGALTFDAGASTGCSVNASTGVITVSNASGTCSISASKAGDNNYVGPVSDGPKSVTLNKATQAALSLTVPVSITYGTTGTATTTGGSGTGAVTFAAGSSTGCAVDASTGVISVSSAIGTCSISASKASDNNYAGPVSDGPKTVTLNKASQAAVTVTGPGSVTFGTTGTAAATGGSGTGAYSFDAGTSNGCSVAGTTLSVSNASGTCSITATRAGDNNYNGSSPSAAFTVTLNKATQAALTLTAPASLTFGTTGTATTTGGSGTGAVTFDAGTSTGCAVNATTGVVSVSNASGNCSITASKAGDNNYLGPVSDGPKTVTLAKAAQSAVTVTAPTSVTFGTTGTATATGGDGTGTYAFDATGSTGCSVAGTTVSVSNASGTCSLTATRAGDNNYNASSQSAAFTVTLNKATQAALSLTVPGSITFGATGTATTSGGSGGGAVSFSAGSSTGCAVNASTGVISVSDASGTCAISASKAGDNNYLGPVSDGPKSVTLNKAAQTALSLTVPVSVTFGTTGTATTTGGSGTGALTFSAGASTGCSVNATTGVISVSNASLLCSISASKAGDNNYLGPVSDGPKSVTLLKAAQATLSLTVPATITYGTTGTATASGGSGTGSLTFDAGSSSGCSVNASTGVISVSNASGTCSVSASKAGDDNYLGPVSDGPKSVTLVKATQSALSLTVPASITFGATGTASTTGGSGTGAVSFDAGTSTGCTVNGTTGVISVNNASGTCAVSASKAGDDNYVGPVTDGPKTVALVKAAQTALSLTVPSSITYGTTGTATTMGGSGTGTLTFDAGTSTGCAVNGSTGVITVSDASGTCAVSASKAGDNNYLGPVSDGPKSVMLNKATQPALSLTVPASVTFGTTGTATTSGGGGTGAVMFDAGASTGCAVNATSGVISVSNASGNCSIAASKAGDNNYLGPVSDGPKSVTLVKANQSAVTVTAPASVTYGTTGTAAATGGDGTGAYSFSAGASTGCSVAGTTVSVSNASNSCSLTATRAGDNNYNTSSPSAAFPVTLIKATQSITFGALINKINGDADFTVSGSASSGLLVTFGVGLTDACTISGSTVHITGAGSCTVTAGQSGNNNYQAAASVPQTFTIAANQAPVLGAISLSASPIQKGTSLNLTSSFTDADVLESAPYTVVIDWGDGSTPTTQSGIANPGSISASHMYSATGVFSVTVSVTDKINTTVAGTQSGVYQYAVVYDPNGGFVTGGGWINSPAGACSLTPACSTTTGKANFGFVSKYQRGQSTPSGDTQFQFQAGGIDFHSVAYDWLVIAGARAQYKGTGTINGRGHYGFMLTAIDGSVNGAGGTDRFRIKIWDIDNGGITVYDNQVGTTDDAGLTTPGTLLGGGSIQIHN